MANNDFKKSLKVNVYLTLPDLEYFYSIPDIVQFDLKSEILDYFGQTDDCNIFFDYDEIADYIEERFADSNFEVSDILDEVFFDLTEKMIECIDKNTDITSVRFERDYNDDETVSYDCYITADYDLDKVIDETLEKLQVKDEIERD